MFIYFIRCGKPGGPIKIGYAKDVEKRLDDLQVANPYPLTVITKIPVESKKKAEKMEKWFHDRFDRQHIRGEWFTGNIKLKRINACLEYAESDRDWDDVRAENGGRYYKRGGNRPLGKFEEANSDKILRKQLV